MYRPHLIFSICACSDDDECSRAVRTWARRANATSESVTTALPLRCRRHTWCACEKKIFNHHTMILSTAYARARICCERKLIYRDGKNRYPARYRKKRQIDKQTHKIERERDRERKRWREKGKKKEIRKNSNIQADMAIDKYRRGPREQSWPEILLAAAHAQPGHHDSVWEALCPHLSWYGWHIKW